MGSPSQGGTTMPKKQITLTADLLHRYIRHLRSLERVPHTIQKYTHDLTHLFSVYTIRQG